MGALTSITLTILSMFLPTKSFLFGFLIPQFKLASESFYHKRYDYSRKDLSGRSIRVISQTYLPIVVP